jgi:hypothetical protein
MKRSPVAFARTPPGALVLAARGHAITKTLALASLALTVTTCTLSTSDDPVISSSPTFSTATQGALRVDWTIDGTTDPSRCTGSLAAAIEITVDGPIPGTFQQACESFATSITLEPGSYEAVAELVDSARQPRTTAVQIQSFTIRPNEELRVPIDFPAASFF